MTLPTVPVVANQAPGTLITAALWNAQVVNSVNFLSGPPLFFGFQATAQSTSNSTAFGLSLDSTTVDTYNGHSNTSNNSRYTAQVAGWYYVQATISFAGNATGSRANWLRVNGATFVVGGYSAVGSAGAAVITTVTAAGMVYLNAGDYVESVGAQYSGGNLSTATTVAYETSSMLAFWTHN